MAPRARRAPSTMATVPANGTLLSLDLDAWAGDRIAHAGREAALLGRVQSLRLAPDGRAVEAKVRDIGRTPYRVQVAVAGDGLSSHCDCAYDSGPVCKHAVAAVHALRFPRPPLQQVAGSRTKSRRAGRLARGQGRIITQAPVQAGTLLAAPGEFALTREERVALARQEELQARKQRARKEKAKVVKLPQGGGPVSFRVAGGDPQASYVVTLRGPEAKLASCTCPDFGKSELQTCKHIERAKAWYSRQPKRIPADLVSVWWSPREWPITVPDPLAEFRLDAPPGFDRTTLFRYFDEQGWIRPAPHRRLAVWWPGRAVREARLAALRQGFHFDLDPAVPGRIEERRTADAGERRLGGVRPDDTLWHETVDGLGFKLHPYQVDGSIFLARRGLAFLADDMGLGKTLQAIVGALLLRRTAGAAKALVVCPASLKHQWRQEIHKACGEWAISVEGNQESRTEAYRNWRSGFLILNYELVLRDVDEILEASADLVILDEAQRIKNWDTKTAKTMKRLSSPHAFILTGTPLENRLSELHSLVEFLHPRALGPRWRLLPMHAVTEPNGRVLAYEALDVLRQRLGAFFLRRERREVLDQLPPRTDNTFWTEMTAAQRRPYRQFSRRVAALLAQNRPLKNAEVRAMLQALTSMRILCNAHAQFNWSKAELRVSQDTAVDREDIRWMHSPKLEEFVRVLDDLLDGSGSKVVVFSQWERLLRLAHFASRPILDRRGERADLFHGGLDGRARARILDAFREKPDRRVLFSTDAGGLGLNLQEAASIVVNLEVPWNPAVLEQRIGRVHRLGQLQSVQVLHFVTKGALEERVLQVVENKRALFDGLLVDEVDRVVLDEAVQATFLDRVRSLIG